MDHIQDRMTEGSIAGKLVRFAVPLFIGNLFQQLYNTADALIVGNMLGNDALAAVSSTGVRERLTRVRPNAASRLRIRRLNAGWVTKRRSAAWEKLRVAARALKSSSHLLSRFITSSHGYAPFWHTRPSS